MVDKISILVNTTDTFEDCWQPFFKLFKKYWPEYTGKIYLNTEIKEFAYEGMNIIPIKNGLQGKPWSQCLKYALDFIEEENIIYMQEDYFLHSPVNHSFINQYYKLFIENELDCLHLTDQCTNGSFNKNTGITDTWEIEKGANYRLSTQAAFWKKESLKKLIRPWESGWQFEHFGTKRSDYILNKIMCVSQDLVKKDKNEIIPYIFTGIIKGKWKREVQELFNKNNIDIDFLRRGFYKHKPKTLQEKVELSLNHKKQISKFRSIVNLKKIKIKKENGR